MYDQIPLQDLPFLRTSNEHFRNAKSASTFACSSFVLMSGLLSSGSSSQSSNEVSSGSSEPPWRPMKPPRTDLEQSSSTVGTSARGSESSAEDTCHEIDDDSYEIKTEECSLPPRSPNNVATSYVSIGHEGTTATVTAMGQLMQITSFLGRGLSGFFCVDGLRTPQPEYVMKRAQKLMELSTGEGPIGLDLGLKKSVTSNTRSLSERMPDLDFIRDRWPRFTTQDEPLRSTRQYFVHDNTVLDFWMFQATSGSKPVPRLGEMSFNAKLLIRELDFVSSRHSFNGHSLKDDGTVYQARRLPAPHGNSIILAHDGSEMVSIGGVIGLVVSFYVNGKPRTIQEDSTISETYSCSINVQEEILSSRPLTVVTAYKLQVLPQGFYDRSTSAAAYFGLKTILKDPYALISFSKDTDLNFIFRRTLEHILSVCSIPVSMNQNGKEKGIALTCGDMSGHRLVNKASFFAFKFLLRVYRFLEKTNNETETEFRKHLQHRIEKTCRAHLKWLFSKSTQEVDHCFATNYWATGVEIQCLRSTENHNFKNNKSTTSYRALCKESLVNTPLQIIKLTEFMDIFKEENKRFQKALEPVVRCWIRSLKEADKRGFTAFPRPETDEYRLRDHVWIWRALKGLEKHGYGNLLGMKDVGMPESQSRSYPARDYSSAAVQSKVLQRFTTENPSSKQRMIAVARTSASTRFMIHSRDAALFYYDEEFFSKARSLWRMTLKAQQFHRENEDSFWNNPLRYAVAVMIGRRGFQINSKPPEDMVERARDVLRRCMSENGLFVGKINDVTKEPELFLDESWRDFYWDVGFEVPFILWDLYQPKRLCSQPNSQGDGKVQSSEENGGSSRQSSDALLDRANPEMKKLLPFNTLIDQSSITELADEWLYPYPDFLDFMPGIEKRFASQKELGTCGLETGEFITEAINSFKKRKMLSEDEELRGILVDVPKAVHSWAYSMNEKHQENPEDDAKPFNNARLQKKLDVWRCAKNAKKRLIWMPNANHETGLLCFLGSPVSERICLASFFDKHEHREKFLCDETTAALNNWQTEFHLSWYRLVRECHRSDCEEISFLGGESKLERAAISFLFIGDFFDRYWTCRVLEYDPDERYEKSPFFNPTKGNEPERPECHSREQSKDQKSRLRNYFSHTGTAQLHSPCAVALHTDIPMRGSMKELQDRFKKIIEPSEVLPKTDIDRRAWRQRKVLELLLFDFALQKCLDHSKEIIEAIIDELLDLLSQHKRKKTREARGSEKGSEEHRAQETKAERGKDQGQETEAQSADQKEPGLPKLNKLLSLRMSSGAYTAFSKRWSTIRYTLQVIEGDLQSTLGLVKLWENREGDREPERPRWTKDDERKYRSAITKLTISNNQRVRQLKQRLTDIQSLSSSLTNRLDSIRNELSFRSASNILVFTWVTFFFLPLGFAAALLSINGVPGRPELTLWGILAGSLLCFTIAIFIVTFHRFSIIQSFSHLKFLLSNRHSNEIRTTKPCSHHKSNVGPQEFNDRVPRSAPPNWRGQDMDERKTVTGDNGAMV